MIANKTDVRTIYVVDDDPAARKSLGALVRSRGLGCAEFASAEEFLHDFNNDVPGALITDLRMDGMSGLDLQHVLNERGSLLPMIVVSGHADVPATVKLMKGGAVMLLQKPYDERDLLASIDAALKENANLRQLADRVRDIGDRLASLTDEEEQMLAHMIEGNPNKTIAQDVRASPRTVDRRRRRVLDKMNVDSIAELAHLVAEFQHARARLQSMRPTPTEAS